MAIAHTLESTTEKGVAQAPVKPRKATVYELIALDPEEEQRLLDDDIDKVLSEGYEILEVTGLIETNEAES